MGLLDYKFYNVEDTIARYPDAKYYVIFGQRSNGKTYSLLNKALKNYHDNGKQFAYIRRYNEDIRSKWMTQLFSPHIKNGVIEKLYRKDNIPYDSIQFSMGKFHLRKNGETKKSDMVEERPCGFVFDLHGMEHAKSVGYPDVDIIIFDEFMSRQGYIANEFVLFTNVVSTIVRQRKDVKVFMLGNTVNKFCPYFQEMGLTHVQDQKAGTIDLYTYGNSELQVVCEYCESDRNRGGKPSDVYFAFDNPALTMITDGLWETAQYPKKKWNVKPKDIVAKFFVEFNGELIQGDLVQEKDCPYVYLHRRTRAIRDDNGEILQRYKQCIIYTDHPTKSIYEMCAITKQSDNLSRMVLRLLNQNRFFYDFNWVGEVWRNYLKWSNSLSILN